MSVFTGRGLVDLWIKPGSNPFSFREFVTKWVFLEYIFFSYMGLIFAPKKVIIILSA